MMQSDILSHRFTGAVPCGLFYEEKFLKLPRFLCLWRKAICIGLARMQRLGSHRMHTVVGNMLCNEEQGLNQSINCTIPKQLWQYLIFSLFSLSTRQHAKNYLMLATTLRKIENYKLCGTQRSRCCRGSTVMTQMVKSSWRTAGFISSLHDLGIREERQGSRQPRR